VRPRAHVSFALVGGLAVSVRTEPRFTRDADLAVALASDAEAQALIRELRAHDYRIDAIVESGTGNRRRLHPAVYGNCSPTETLSITRLALFGSVLRDDFRLDPRRDKRRNIRIPGLSTDPDS